MTQPKIYFTKEHEWVSLVGENTVRVGITEHASNQLGDIVFVDYTAGLKEVTAGEEIITVESVKSVSEVYTPVTGMIVKQNESLDENPEVVNDSPLDEGWMVEITLANPAELEGLLSQEEYNTLVEEEE
ncbi:glycine cleavage system protein GcvH [Jeotgalibaca sp. MA1X17-3]|uniref:glycine cleavage system protein GcvH n=1 Tax=Jeotgalibaca sp. MA1X17-3 TaxID=2908211 RepID=UPI001F30A60A|nr:glycine cleavage system protein GcvH [Jeotgalibaca sp. MA1X17-3]UJF16496.1 glycine cleavage system protein GcvH [Jeotgalibaca sp. MA1X17-3]